MHGSFHKWLFLPLLLALLTISFPASAQGGVTLDNVTIQLWPEFDQPAMLVILNAQLAPTVALPVELTFQLPGDVDKPYVVAVGPTAQTVSDQQVEFTYQKNGDWLEVAVNTDYPAIQIEYYDPGLSIKDDNRSFTFLWPGNYAVDTFNVSLRAPVDTTQVTTDPQMRDVTPAGSKQTFLEWGTSNLEAGDEVPIQVMYTKTTDRLSVSDQPLETGIVDEFAQGRISLSNYLPYILAGLGILLILTGGLYFWQYSKGRSRPRLRHPVREEEPIGGDVYCHQCGKRAQAGDRFCRTCGTRLRKET